MIATILLGIAAMTIAPAQETLSGAQPAPQVRAAANEIRAKGRCNECGVIESTRRVAPVGNAPALYEITVRMYNGAIHVLTDPNPADWRPGERTILISGVDASGR